MTGGRVAEICADNSTFLPDRTLDEDSNILIRMEGGGKGIISVSQIATGEENALRIKIYASKGAVVWDQENPNYLSVYRYGDPRQTWTRGAAYASGDSTAIVRVPTGHPEGYLEAFANIYRGLINAVRSHIDEEPKQIADYNFPTVYDGLRGLQFIYAAVESAKNDSRWVRLDSV